MKVLKIPSSRFGHTIYVHRNLNSTQNKAFELARNGENQGTIVVAQTQENGRGRFDKLWVSDKGGLYFSIIYRPERTLAEVIGLTKTIGLCVKKAVEKTIANFMRIELKTKGINDILLNNRKLCGILIETESYASGEENNQPSFYIIGIGVNVNQKHFPRHYESIATSLRIETDRFFSRFRILKAICETLGNTLPN
jgi:BirA family biotin operon repressor/biotin-[acetyl-CoA-carboxylase] ligase